MDTNDEDVTMESNMPATESMLKLSDGAGGNIFLIKMPQWIAETIASSNPGTQIGLSQDITGVLEAGEELRLILKQTKAQSSQPSEYALSLPVASQNLRVLETSGSTTSVSRVTSTIHMIPKRDQKYANLLKERLNQADISHQHRTVHNEEDFSTSRTAVKLFQRPEAVPDTTSPESAGGRNAKRIRALDELPQRESRAAGISAASPLTLDDALMETLVNRDEGWPLQQLSKVLKDKGVSAPLAQLKAKLLEICVYQRRGEDAHPKYYLKSEYK